MSDARDSALVRAVSEDDLAAVRSALAAGADPNELRRSGRSVLETATLWGREAIVLALLGSGANVTSDSLCVLGQMDVTDWIIESRDVESRFARIAAMLIQRGASPHVTAWNGRPLIDLFSEELYPNIHRVLADAIAAHERDADPE